MKKVLVTGASGWIGRHCIRPLVDLGFEVHGTYLVGTLHSDEHVKWHRVDLLDPRGRLEIIENVRPTHLLHLALYAGPGYRTAESNWSWLGASMDLFGLFLARGGQRIVGAGTSLEYDWSIPECLESLPATLASTPYGRCKLWLGKTLNALAESYTASSAWGRIFFSFGPHERPERLVPQVISGLLKGEDVACSEGSQVRQFMYVGDLGEAFAALIASDVRGPINMAGGELMSIRQLVERISDRIESPGNVIFGARATGGDDAAPLLFPNSARMRLEVGWEPKTSTDAAIERTITWWREQISSQCL